MLVLVLLVIGVISLAWLWLQHNQSYWHRRGIPQKPPKLFMGNMSEWGKTKHITEIVRDTYNSFKGSGPFAGMTFFILKSVVVMDLDLAKNILIKDFSYFDERGLYTNERDDPLTGNLFFIDGTKWRKLRHKMTPTFTSGKMKSMFPLVTKVGEELNRVMSEKLSEVESSTQTMEISQILGRYTADVIGSCAFGLECNSMRADEAEFVTMGRRFFTHPRHNRIVDALIRSAPNVARFLHMRTTDQKVHDFYMGIVRDAVAYRERENIKRDDFMGTMIDLMKETSLKDAEGNDIGRLTLEELAAEAFLFFIAGFETSSTTMSFALYELAQAQRIQDKAREHVLEVLLRHNGEFTYESMKEMHYVDQIIDETLRLHPVAPQLVRTATKHYETADPKYYIEKGTFVVIPSIAIHHDPDYYPDPEKFMPERFNPEEVEKRPSCTFLPFGEGPRNCIGARFGKMQTIVGLAYLLKSFKFSVSPETEIPYKLDLRNFLLLSKNGIKLRVEKI